VDSVDNLHACGQLDKTGLSNEKKNKKTDKPGPLFIG
jgi:hypothetical protein